MSLRTIQEVNKVMLVLEVARGRKWKSDGPLFLESGKHSNEFGLKSCIEGRKLELTTSGSYRRAEFQGSDLSLK